MTRAYPFHPTALSVFERKWQALPRFQQTRGILRLLALWVARAYQDGYKGAHRDPLIGLGTAPLDDAMFRPALFEQLGETKLEAAVTTDIAGKKDSHAVRLDKEAAEAIKKARLHRKVATTIFFESNGGQARGEATVPEIRLAVAEPGLDIGNVDTVLETLGTACYFLSVEKNRYRFGLSPNLNKILADRRASIQPPKIDEQIRSEVQKVFPAGSGPERVFFPEKSIQVPDRPVLTLVVLPPEQSMQESKRTAQLVESFTKEYGASSRTFKSALIWCVPDSADALRDEARKLLAWEEIDDEKEELRLSDAQARQLSENLKRARRDLAECVWRSYKNLMLLDKDNKMQTIDLGLVHSSAATSLVKFLLDRLRQDDIVTDSVSPNVLLRSWPPAFTEWSTKAVRDAFFASPQFRRLINGDSVKETIARGVSNGLLAYVGKKQSGVYEPFIFNTQINAGDVEISEEMFIITGTEAKKLVAPPKLTTLTISPSQAWVRPDKRQTFVVKGLDQNNREIAVGEIKWTSTGGTIGVDGVLVAGKDEGSFVVKATIGALSGSAAFVIAHEGSTTPPLPLTPETGSKKLVWQGEVPAQKWMNFYTKVLARFAGGKGLKVTVTVEATPDEGVSDQKVEETKVALRELGLDDEVRT